MTSDKLFSESKVTVINFWFTTCKPCVGELGDLEALNKELASKGRPGRGREFFHARR